MIKYRSTLNEYILFMTLSLPLSSWLLLSLKVDIYCRVMVKCLGTLSTGQIYDADVDRKCKLPLVTVLASRLVDVPDDKLRQVPFRRNDSLFFDSKFS